MYDNKFLVAALQFNPEMYERDKNVQRLYEDIEQLFIQGVELVVTPEMATTGYGYTSRREIAPYVDTIPGITTHKLSELTEKYHAYVVVGMPEIDAETGLYYNSAALVGPEGYIGKYRKTHQWETEEHWATWGDLGVPVYETELGRIAMNICMDSVYFESARLAGVQDADILAFSTNSSAGAIAALPARAMQNGLYIISANRSNTEKGFHMIGASAIWSPYGEKLKEAPLVKTQENDINKSYAVVAKIDKSMYENSNKQRLMDRYSNLYKDLSLYISPWDYTKVTNEKQVNALALQYEPVIGEIETNKKIIKELMREQKDLDLVVLPELSLTGVIGGDREQVEQYVNQKEAQEFATTIAKEYNTAIVIGSIGENNGELYNVATFIDKTGDILGAYKKIHLSDSDKRWATSGDEFVVVETEDLGKVGLLIGDDVCFPEATGIMAIKRADIIAIPSAWYGQYGGMMAINKEISENEYPENSMVLWDAVAMGAQSYTIVANYTGTSKGYKGGSALYGLDPLYGLDTPSVASSNEMEALKVSFTTIQNEWWFNQQRLISSRRTMYYLPLFR